MTFMKLLILPCAILASLLIIYSIARRSPAQVIQTKFCFITIPAKAAKHCKTLILVLIFMCVFLISYTFLVQTKIVSESGKIILIWSRNTATFWCLYLLRDWNLNSPARWRTSGSWPRPSPPFRQSTSVVLINWSLFLISCVAESKPATVDLQGLERKFLMQGGHFICWMKILTFTL